MANARALSCTAAIQAVANDSAALDCLRNGKTKEFAARVRELTAEHGVRCHLDNESSIRIFASWCGGNSSVSGLIFDYRAGEKKRYRAKDRFVRRLGLNTKKFDRDAYLRAIPTKVVSALPEAYPPVGEIISESDAIFNKWDKRFRCDDQPDDRKRRLPIHALQPERLVVDLGPQESMIFKDERGKVVGMAMHDFCPDEGALAWATRVATDVVPERKNIRVRRSAFHESLPADATQMEDTGKLVQIGYSARARSKPNFDWVRNLLKRSDLTTAEESDVECSSLFAFAWQLMRARLPAEVMDDFDNYLEATQLKRMDGNGRMGSGAGTGRGTYSVNVGEHSFDFHNVELAPPTGVFGQNYSRAIHVEKQPHKFAASWTLSRNRGKVFGCHFYLARYGVRIQAAPNTLIVWIPQEAHGTSLPKVNPYVTDPGFCQQGLAFVTSNRLPGIWKKYQAGLVDQKGAEAELGTGGDDES